LFSFSFFFFYFSFFFLIKNITSCKAFVTHISYHLFTMLVDNPLLQSSFFASASAPSSYPEYPTDLNDIFDTDLFNSTFATSSSSSPGSRGSSPQNLLTPPQEVPPTSFPEIHDDNSTNQFFSLFNGFDGSYGGPIGDPTDCAIGYDLGMDVSNMGMSIPPIDDPMQMRGIDPQLVDTPSAVSDHDDEPEEEQDPSSLSDALHQPQEESPFTIAPVKVGGFGKARKGTVQSGGVVKKTPNTYVNKNKENPQNAVFPTSKRPSPPKATKQSPTSLANTTPVSTGPFSTGNNSTAGSEAGDDEADLPENWRPSPEVLAKMTSKEKRQLRNKISARNFRVRRKEYITTLEGDIAERDRLLDHFRTQLGSQESENLALRQEIATLKKALLEGRGSINLPPPAPLPEQSAAESLAAANTNTSTTSITTVQNPPLLTANTQKDLPSSPRIGGPRFWGGVGIGGGVTPVHTALVPDIGTLVRNGLQENMNPSLNAMHGASAGNGIGPNKNFGGFDGFADLNPFTMKTLDAYRMHLWGKMAAQQQLYQQNQVLQNLQNPSNLTSNMRPHFFSTSPKPNLSSPSSGYGSTLSALLSGKHNSSSSLSSSAYPTPPTSHLLLPKGASSLPVPLLHSSQATSSTSINSSSSLLSTQKEQQHAMLAAMASQTVLRKLGNAFWDAFVGSSSQSSSSSSPRGDWDADKVRKVLEGKAVLRVVDVEPVTTTTPAVTSASVSSSLNAPTSTPSAASPRWKGAALRRSTASSTSSASSNSSHATEDGCRAKTAACVCDILEESMRSLSMGKKM
jgi:hypothetical protein